MSHREMKRRGWTRVDPRPWRKCSAVWRRDDGAELQHCGHPTALQQWMLVTLDDSLFDTAPTLELAVARMPPFFLRAALEAMQSAPLIVTKESTP